MGKRRARRLKFRVRPGKLPFMTFLPIVARELRVASRRGGLYWNRVVAATLALGLGAIVYVSTAEQPPPVQGRALFWSLAWLAFVFCLLAGARLTADTLSEERREGTLGLLFLTDLRGYDIVLGKLAACSLNGVYSLLAVVPIMALALLFGGVSGRQFGLTVLVLANTLFCSLAVGCWVSTWFENGRRAVLTTVLLLLGLRLGPVLVFWWRVVRSDFTGTPDFVVLAPSPAYALLVALLPANLMPPGAWTAFGTVFWPSVGLVFGLGVAALVLSSLAVPRVWRDRPAGSWRERLRRARWRWEFGAGDARAARRRRLLAESPICWLHARERLKPWRVWLVLAAAGTLLGWARWRFPQDWNDPGLLMMFSQALYGILKLWMAAAAVGRLAEDRRRGSLELLLTAPLTLCDFTRGLGRALRRQFLGPIVAVLAIDVWFCTLHLQQEYSEPEMVVALYAARMSLLGLDALTLWQLAPWVAVTSRHPNQAAAHLLIRVCVLPWLVFLGGMTLLSLLDFWGRWDFEPTEGQVLGAWFGLGLANDLFWLAHARRRMTRHFREAAAARFAPRRWRGPSLRTSGPPREAVSLSS